jgi:hypothetical protein
VVKEGNQRTQLGGTTKLTGVDTLDPMKSLDSGVFWIGSLPYGWYIIEEPVSENQSKFFFLLVTEKGTYGTLGDDGKDVVDGYTSRSAAETQAKKVYDKNK